MGFLHLSSCSPLPGELCRRSSRAPWGVRGLAKALEANPPTLSLKTCSPELPAGPMATALVDGGCCTATWKFHGAGLC